MVLYFKCRSEHLPVGREREASTLPYYRATRTLSMQQDRSCASGASWEHGDFSCEWHLPCPTWNGSRIWHRKSSARWALCLVTISRMHMSLPSPGPVKNEPVVHNAPHPVHDTVHMPAGLCEGAGCNGKTVKW